MSTSPPHYCFKKLNCHPVFQLKIHMFCGKSRRTRAQHWCMSCSYICSRYPWRSVSLPPSPCSSLVAALVFVVHCGDVIVAGQPREQNRIPLCTEGRPRTLDGHVLLSAFLHVASSRCVHIHLPFVLRAIATSPNTCSPFGKWNATGRLTCGVRVKTAADEGEGKDVKGNDFTFKAWFMVWKGETEGSRIKLVIFCMFLILNKCNEKSKTNNELIRLY